MQILRHRFRRDRWAGRRQVRRRGGLVEKAVEMDGSRSLAWLNLGDARLQAGDEGKATAAYKTFLELAPKHVRAAEVQGWIANPSEGTRPKAL